MRFICFANKNRKASFDGEASSRIHWREEAFFMDYDLQKETRVWERIRGAENERHGDVEAEEIRSLIRDELADESAYRTLAACLPQKERRCLLAIAHDESRHAKTLAAMYFLQQGRRVCPEPPPRLCVTCLCEELRKRYREELAGAEQYDALARRAGEFAPQITGIAEDERGHAQTILRLLQRLL